MNDISIGYSKEYDAYFDLETGEWIDPRCSDPECEFCKNRPARALQRQEQQ